MSRLEAKMAQKGLKMSDAVYHNTVRGVPSRVQRTSSIQRLYDLLDHTVFPFKRRLLTEERKR